MYCFPILDHHDSCCLKYLQDCTAPDWEPQDASEASTSLAFLCEIGFVAKSGPGPDGYPTTWMYSAGGKVMACLSLSRLLVLLKSHET